MSQEDIKVHINNALDMLQMITEDVEDNFVTADVDNGVKARATMTISTLYILSDYLRNICKEGAQP